MEFIKVELIQTTPNTDTTAEAIEVNKLALITSELLVLVINIIAAEAVRVITLIIVTIDKEPLVATASVLLPGSKLGTKFGNAPAITIRTMAKVNIKTEVLAPAFKDFSSPPTSVCMLFANSESFIFSKKIGSTFNSAPFLKIEKQPISIPIIQAGMHIIIISTKAPG
ncbi:hypothetical protein D3C84_922900 [compost metagenome]